VPHQRLVSCFQRLGRGRLLTCADPEGVLLITNPPSEFLDMLACSAWCQDTRAPWTTGLAHFYESRVGPSDVIVGSRLFRRRRKRRHCVHGPLDGQC